MRFCVLTGSPRPQGNTAELLKPFAEELGVLGGEVELISLADKDIRPCLGCYACQQVAGAYGCVQCDDVADVMARIVGCDCLVLATPIYTWYCTPPMKALLDRTFGLNKYYRGASGSLWAGKHMALITTHGYKAAYAAEPFETGVRRLCEHSKLNYIGMYSVRDLDDLASFRTSDAVEGAREFAQRLVAAMDGAATAQMQ